MLISKFDLTFFSPHRKGVGFRRDYETEELLRSDTGYYTIIEKLSDFFEEVC